MKTAITKNIFYVYAYLDPRKPGKYVYDEFKFDYEPFYIGKGKGKRILEHLKNSTREKTKNDLKSNKINKIIKSKLFPIILKVKENIIEKKAFDIEKKLVYLIGKKTNKTGPLLNIMDGGGESRHFFHSKEAKQKIRLAQIGEKHHYFGKKLSKEHIKKMSDIKKIPILQYDLNGNFIKEWDSAKDASLFLTSKLNSLSHCIDKNNRTCNGFFWKKKKGKIKQKIKVFAPIVCEQIFQYSLDGNFIKKWDKIKDASDFYNINYHSISSVCHYRIKTAANHIWRFVSDGFIESENLSLEELDKSKHISRHGLVSKKISKTNIVNKEIKVYNSLTDAAKNNGISISYLSVLCKNKKEYNGFLWKHV